MDEIIIFPLNDKNGNEIKSGNIVKYNDNTYIILYIEKNDIGWVLSPCGNNIENEDIKIDLNDENIDLEVIE